MASPDTDATTRKVRGKIAGAVSFVNDVYHIRIRKHDVLFVGLKRKIIV